MHNNLKIDIFANGNMKRIMQNHKNANPSREEVRRSEFKTFHSSSKQMSP